VQYSTYLTWSCIDKFADVCRQLTDHKSSLLVSSGMSVNCIEAGLLDNDSVVRPCEATNEDLLTVHSKSYLENLKVCYLWCFTHVHI